MGRVGRARWDAAEERHRIGGPVALEISRSGVGRVRAGGRGGEGPVAGRGGEVSDQGKVGDVKVPRARIGVPQLLFGHHLACGQRRSHLEPGDPGVKAHVLSSFGLGLTSHAGEGLAGAKV